MSCEKNLRSNILPSSDPGGTWTYIGYDSSSPTGTFEDTPTQSLVLVDVGEQVGTDDNPLVNPTDATPGFYKFSYTVTINGLDPNACTTTNEIIIQVTQGPCSGADNAVYICTDEAPLLLADLLEDAAECSNFSLGVVGGTALNIPSYNEITTQIDPSTTNLGTYTFINTTAPVVQNGFSLGCTDCASSTSTLTFTISKAHTVEKLDDLGICLLDDTQYQSGDLMSSSNPTGRWVYVGGATVDASLIWDGQPINVSPDTTLGNKLNVPFKANGLPIGEHIFRYYGSEDPCERFDEFKITVSEPPNSGIFTSTFNTLCGSASCSSMIINDMLTQETAPGSGVTGVFTISTQHSFDSTESAILSWGSSSLGSSFTFDANNSTFSGVTYGSHIRFVVSKLTVFDFSYTVTKDGCSRTTNWSVTVYPSSNLITPINSDLRFCSASDLPENNILLFKDNFDNFFPGGQFRVFWRPNSLTGQFSQIDNNTTGLIGNPFYYYGITRPPDNSHSLTTGLNFSSTSGIRPGYYRVDYIYFGAPNNTNAIQCPSCATVTKSFFITYSGSSCGCDARCDVNLDPYIIYQLDITPSYNSGGNTFTNFNLRNALTSLGYSLTALRCGNLPNYNLWTFYNINNTSVAIPNETINFSSIPYGVYTFEFRPRRDTFDFPAAIGENNCYRSFVSLQINSYTTTPCELTQVTITKSGDTLTALANNCPGTITYSWVGPGGYTASGATITPLRPGTYAVTANCAAVPNCTSSASATVDCADINLRVVDGLANDLSIQAFFDGYCDLPTYRWTVTVNGNTTTTITTSNTLPLASGTSEVVVELLCGGTATGCFADFTCTAGVNIINNGQTLTAQYSGCSGSIANDHNLIWVKPDGSTVLNTTQLVPDQVGTYTLTLRCLSTGCGGSATTTVTANCNLAVGINIVGGNLVASPSGSCPYGNLRYNWTIVSSTGVTSTITDQQQVPYIDGSQYTVTLNCDSGLLQNCSATASFTCPNFTINIQ